MGLSLGLGRNGSGRQLIVYFSMLAALLLVALGDASATALATPPSAAVSFGVSYTSPTEAGYSHDLTITALNRNGNVAVGYRGTVSLTSGDSAATLPAAYTFNSGDQGVHTFTNGATLFTSGAQTITAADGPVTGQASVTVLAGPAASLTFESAGLLFDGQPIDTKLGAPTYHSCIPPAASATNPCAVPPASAPVSVLLQTPTGTVPTTRPTRGPWPFP